MIAPRPVIALPASSRKKVLSCGAGMQSTALALMSCENKIKGYMVHPLVPIYDLIVFCDLGAEPYWVYDQVAFIGQACKKAGIPFVVLQTDLYGHYMERFGRQHVSSIPFWSLAPDGTKAKMKRACTIDFKILKIQQHARYNLLGYRPKQWTRAEDIGKHEMHIGFSAEEKQRTFKSLNPMYVNHYPLVDMGLTRADNFKYILEEWGLETKASACIFCPFHRNYFFQHLQKTHGENYAQLVAMDKMLEERQPDTKIRSKLFVSRSCKRIEELTPDECHDAECFQYRGHDIWNGF